MVATATSLLRVIFIFAAVVTAALGTTNDDPARMLPPGTTLTPPTAPGVECSTSGTRGYPPVGCTSPGVCVLTSFGDPPVDLPNAGICRLVPSPVPACSVGYCSSAGPRGVCKVSGQTAFCSAWAARADHGSEDERPNCRFACILSCSVVRLVASNGKKFCNDCLLRSASCVAKFEIFGPVTAPRKCFTEAIEGVFDARRCCRAHRVGCLPPLARCSTGGSLLPPTPCEKSMKCVVRDFGFPAVDNPRKGFCQWVYNIKKCNVNRCSKNGADHICRIERMTTTCGAWATRGDGGTKPNCMIACPEFCLVYKKRPLASDGKRYCSRCQLKAVSCNRDFMIYGPVAKE